MVWHVFLYGIQWDDYAVSELPENLRVTIESDAESNEEVIGQALTEVVGEFDSLIAGTEQIVVRRI